jgi:hypothetical protein
MRLWFGRRRVVTTASLGLAIVMAFLVPVGVASAGQPLHDPPRKIHRKPVRHFSPPYGAPARSVLGTPSVLTPTAPAPSFAPAPPPAREARPALVTPGAPAYGPGILGPGPGGTGAICAPLSRSQGLC